MSSINNEFRGNDITSLYTFEQLSEKIKNDDLSDLYIGDYISKNIQIDEQTITTKWRIADSNYFIGYGDTECNTNHLVLVLDDSLFEFPISQENKNDTGYKGSIGYTQYISLVDEKIKEVFDKHILSYRYWFTTNNKGDGEWTDCVTNLLSENQVFGTQAFMDIEEINILGQFKIFNLKKELISNGHKMYWLSTLFGRHDFALILGDNVISKSYGTTKHNMRPYFLFF